MRILFFVLWGICSTNFLFAQPVNHKGASSSVILDQIRALKTVGSALYVAAHPDDENTRVIAWLAQELKLNTTYISLTRGDGGQNLIGEELGVELGIIRTQELLEARKLDGGAQLFSRANDFGFSKTPNETFTIWNKQQVLADLVWAIRKTRPDIIITRFNVAPGTTHGHHTASSMLAQEAMLLAGDPTQFPEQLQFVTPWTPTRLMWNTSPFFFTKEFEANKSKFMVHDVGGYLPLLGYSLTEISAYSRSAHKSQGFGTMPARGETLEYFEHTSGRAPQTHIADGIDFTWNRLEGGTAIANIITQIEQKFNPDAPYQSVPALLSLRAALKKLKDPFWANTKIKAVEHLIVQCLGLFADAWVSDYVAAPGDSLTVFTEVTLRTPVQVSMESSAVLPNTFLHAANTPHGVLTSGKPAKDTIRGFVSAQMPISQPYWLRNKGTLGMYTVPEQELIGLPENKPALTWVCTLKVNGDTLIIERPVHFKRLDPVDGEQYKPLYITPKACVNFTTPTLLFAQNTPQTVQVNVTGFSNKSDGRIRIQAPAGWKISPEFIPVSWSRKRQQQTVSFSVTPPQMAGSATLIAQFIQEADTLQQAFKEIAYPHILTQVYFPMAELQVTKLDLTLPFAKIGYINGAGDAVDECLQQAGLSVEQLEPTQFKAQNASHLPAILVGIRAFNTLEESKFLLPELFAYAANGGTVVMQYNTSNGLKVPNLMPYDFQLSRDRITEENAALTMLDPNHPAFTQPHQITQADFSNWVQERGLYFAGSWDPQFTPLLAGHDTGEADKKGILLVLPYGKGHLVYTGLSFFRQLPAGVPGAYRLLINLLAL